MASASDVDLIDLSEEVISDEDEEFVSLADHNASLWCNEQGADVYFICYDQYGKEQKIPAHKLFLMRSDMMKTEFFGLMPEINEVVIKDIPAEGFKEFLKFLYMDKVEPPIVLAPQLLLCAKKYLMKGLQKRCIKYMESHLMKYDLYCLMLLQSLLQVGEEESTLAEKCLQLIETHADKVVQQDAFMQLESATLQIILQRDELDIDEPKLYRALVKWSVQKCLDENGSLDEQTQRQQLEPLMTHISFYHINIADLSKLMNEFQVLSDHTIAQIMLAYQNEGIKQHLPFKDAPRYRKSVEVAKKLEDEGNQPLVKENRKLEEEKKLQKEREMFQRLQYLENELQVKIKKNRNLEMEKVQRERETNQRIQYLTNQLQKGVVENDKLKKEMLLKEQDMFQINQLLEIQLQDKNKRLASANRRLEKANSSLSFQE